MHSYTNGGVGNAALRLSKRKVFDTLGYVTTFRDSNTLNMLSRTGHKSDVNCIKFDKVALQSNRNYLLSDCGTILWPPAQPISTAAMAFTSTHVVTNNLRMRKVRLCGVAEALRESNGEPRWDVYQAAFDRTVAAVRAQLDKATLPPWRRRGRKRRADPADHVERAAIVCWSSV